MSSNKDNNRWIISYSYKLTPESQKYFYDHNGVVPSSMSRHTVEQELERLSYIDRLVDMMNTYPEAEQLIKKIVDK